MFDGVQSSNPLLPILDQHYVVAKIMNAVLYNHPRVMMPWILNVVWVLRGILPISWFDRVTEILGVSSSMDQFKGRGAWWSLGKKNKDD